MSVESAREFLVRYVTDGTFREQVDGAEEGSGFARQAGYEFSQEELEQAAGAVAEGGAAGLSRGQTEAAGAAARSALDIPTLSARALYGTWPWGESS